MRLALPLFVLLLAVPSRAQTPGQCALGRAEARLDASDVTASLFNTGSLFFNGETTSGYVVPRFTGKSPIFAAGLWVGGRVGGDVRVAAARYTNFNFWPGPLDATTGRPVNPADCSAYDRIYTVNLNDIATYEQTGAATADLAAWPVGLGAATVDAGGQRVVPTSLAQTIDLAAGERPVVYGSQTAFWVMNDVGNVHAGSQSAPIGIEVRVHAFAVAGSDETLARATFYRVEVVYRGTTPLEGARLSLFTDPDLGYATDDYIGTDAARGMAFVYNTDNDDEGTFGYGVAPPAVGFDLLDGAGASSYFFNGVLATSDPSLAAAVYNFQQGLWGDASPVRAYGTGYQQTQGAVTPFVFPGDPVAGQPWSEVNNGTAMPVNVPGDRRLAVSSQAFTLQPGESQTFDLAILYARGSSNLASITALRQASDRVQAIHDDGSLYTPGLGGPLPPLPGSTTLVSPADGADVGLVRSVPLDWTSAQDATGYAVEVALDPAFTQEARQIEVAADSLAFGPDPNTQKTYYWRVRAINGAGVGTLSAARRFTAFGPYAPRVEGVEEWDANGPITTNADGTATDASLLNSPNSTRTQPPTYIIGAGGAPSDNPAAILDGLNVNGYLAANAAREYELRWVDPSQGQVVFNRRWNRADPARAFLTCVETGTVTDNTAAPSNLVTTPAPVVGGYPRMPFQLWEIDPDGTERQVHINVLDSDGDLCYSFTSLGTDPLNAGGYEFIYGSRVPYVESELSNPAEVHARANVGSATAQAFGRLTIIPRVGPARPPQPGTRTRIVTLDAYGTSGETPPAETIAVAVDAARPNPVRSRARARVRFTTATAGAARLTLVDVLGRRVAVLAEGERAAGAHEATLDAGRLASGVYLLVLESGGARAVRAVTVVR